MGIEIAEDLQGGAARGNKAGDNHGLRINFSSPPPLLFRVTNSMSSTVESQPL
jgi:hypothetical protein